MTPAAQVFKSRIDTWLIVVLGIALAVPIGMLGMSFAGSTPLSAFTVVTMGLSLAIGVGLPVSLLRGTSYTIEADTLTVRSGPMKRVVQLRSIKRITPSRTIESAPALSLDRLVIEYGVGEQVVISPKEKAGFLAALANAGVAVGLSPAA